MPHNTMSVFLLAFGPSGSKMPGLQYRVAAVRTVQQHALLAPCGEKASILIRIAQAVITRKQKQSATLLVTTTTTSRQQRTVLVIVVIEKQRQHTFLNDC